MKLLKVLQTNNKMLKGITAKLDILIEDVDRDDILISELKNALEGVIKNLSITKATLNTLINNDRHDAEAMKQNALI